MARNFQILLVEDSEKERASLRRAVAMADLAVIGEASFGQEAFSLARSLRPDVVLISMEQPVIRALRTIEAFATNLPEVPVVAVSSLRDNESLRKAMVAGSREYVNKPVQLQQLRQAVHTAVESLERRSGPAPLITYDVPVRSGTIVTVFGAKGGVGKTTLSTNLAVNLAHLTHQKVAVLDLDHQFGGAPVMLDLRPGVTLDEFREAIDRIDDENIHELMVDHHSGVSMLSLPATPSGFQPLDEQEALLLLEILGRRFDYVVVDTPPAINGGVQAAMETSTMVIVVTTLEVACVKNTRDVLDMMREWEFFEDKVKLVINRPNASNGLQQGDIEKTLHYPVVTKVPFDDTLAMAGQLGKQLSVAGGKGGAVRSLSQLLTAITGIVPQESNKGGLARLFGR